MHVIDQARDRIRIGIGPDAMAEVEDVPGRGTGFFEHRIRVTPQLLRALQKSAAGSRFPCTALVGPRIWRTCASPMRQSTPMTSTSSCATAGMSADPWLR